MGFHYGREKVKFDRAWAKSRDEFKAAGMSSENIHEIYELDWKTFCSDRIYAMHTQPMPCEVIDENMTEPSTLFQKFESTCTTADEETYIGRYFWIEAIESPHLAKVLKSLSTSDLELLTLICIEGFSQRDIARKWDCSQSAVAQKFCRIKKLFK